MYLYYVRCPHYNTRVNKKNRVLCSKKQTYCVRSNYCQYQSDCRNPIDRHFFPAMQLGRECLPVYLYIWARPGFYIATYLPKVLYIARKHDPCNYNIILYSLVHYRISYLQKMRVS